MRQRYGFGVVVVVCWSGLGMGLARAAELPPHPRLLLNATDVAALKEKIAGPFAAQWKQMLASADRMLAQKVQLPPRGGNWSHNYVCPTHGARLKRGKQIGPWQWEHTCPIGPHTLKGDPSKGTTDFDGNGIAGVHGDYADATVMLGVAFQVTGDEKYARRAREILLAYADKYLTYALHDNQGKPAKADGRSGRIASQSLTEASLLINFVQGADLVWQTLSDDDRQAIESRFFRPALDEVIIPGDKKGPHNIQCRQNSAIGLVGFLLNDQPLISRAIDDPTSGFRTQIAKGVLDDGMWYEGSSGYHFFTLDGLWPLAEAARHGGINLYDPRYKSMFDVPLAMAMPDLRMANFNDSGYTELAGKADAYELAYARWHDDSYLRLLNPSNRTGRLALLYGVAKLPSGVVASATTPSASSRNLPASGYAILEQGTGTDATWLALKYGPHGGGHGHFDKNHFILYAHGNVIMPDAGTHAYGSPLHGSWDKHSLAHNTLVVDGKSQAAATGKSLAFGSQNGVDFAMTDAGDIYKDKAVRFVRTVAMVNPNLIVVVDDVHADAEHTYDLAVHLNGKWDGLPEGRPRPTPDGDGYAVIQDLATRTTEESVTLGTDRARVTLAEGFNTEIMTGTGVGESTEDRVPVAIFRRKGTDARYVWAIALDDQKNDVETIQSPSQDTIAVLVTTRSGPVRLYVDLKSHSVTVNKEPLR